jgi:hypothetical protein
MFFGSTVLLVGGIITGTAHSQSVFLGGRFLTGKIPLKKLLWMPIFMPHPRFGRRMCWGIRQIIPGRACAAATSRYLHGIPELIVRASVIPLFDLELSEPATTSAK